MRVPICFWLVGMVVGYATCAQAEDWPQWRGPQRDGVWRESGILAQFPDKQIPHRWSVPIGSGYSGPTVADGRVFVTDRLVEPKQVERVHCFDAQSGKQIWSYTYDCPYEGIGYDAGPRAAVTVSDGKAFALGAMGHLHVFRADTGELLWMSDLNQRFSIRMPIWGIAAAPLLYQNLVVLQIGGSPDACIVALDQNTGQEVWRALEDQASYSAPILIEQAGQPVLVCWTGDRIAGLQPASGELIWQSPFKPKEMVINIATPVVEEDRLFVTSFYDGSKMLRLGREQATVETIWRKRGPSEQQTEALHSIIATPLMIDAHIYGVDSYGELRCLEAETGRRLWENQTATPRARWSNIHMVRHDDRVWMFNERGELIIARLSPAGYEEISRAQLIEPTTVQLNRRGKGVCWAHPAFANRHIFARSDSQLVCADLAAKITSDSILED